MFFGHIIKVRSTWAGGVVSRQAATDTGVFDVGLAIVADYTVWGDRRRGTAEAGYNIRMGGVAAFGACFCPPFEFSCFNHRQKNVYGSGCTAQTFGNFGTSSFSEIKTLEKEIRSLSAKIDDLRELAGEGTGEDRAETKAKIRGSWPTAQTNWAHRQLPCRHDVLHFAMMVKYLVRPNMRSSTFDTSLNLIRAMRIDLDIESS